MEYITNNEFEKEMLEWSNDELLDKIDGANNKSTTKELWLSNGVDKMIKELINRKIETDDLMYFDIEEKNKGKEEILLLLDMYDLVSISEDKFMHDQDFLDDINNMNEYELVDELVAAFEDLSMLEFNEIISIYTDYFDNTQNNESKISEQKLYTTINEFKQSLIK